MSRVILENFLRFFQAGKINIKNLPQTQNLRQFLYLNEIIYFAIIIPKQFTLSKVKTAIPITVFVLVFI